MKKVIVVVLIVLLIADMVFLWRIFSSSEDGDQVQQEEQVQQQQQELQQGERGLLLGIVSSRDGAPVPGATVRAVNRADARTEEVQSGADGSYSIYLSPGSYVLAAEQERYELSIPPEGVEISPNNHKQQDIQLVPKGQAGPPPGPGDPAGYIFGKGAQDENEVKVILAAHGLLENNEILSIVPVGLTGDGLSVYYRDGQTAATYVDSFTNEPAWKVDFASGDIIYVQHTCANVAIPPKEAKAIVAPAHHPQTPGSMPCCVVTVETTVETIVEVPSPPLVPTLPPIPIPIPTLTPGPTPPPTPLPTLPSIPEPTPKPTPTLTPVPTPTPTPTPTPMPTLHVSLIANPNAGYAPLNGVDLIVNVSGTATGLIYYQLDCTNDGIWERETTTADVTFHAMDVCTYPEPGVYKAKARVIRQGLMVEGTSVLIVEQ